MKIEKYGGFVKVSEFLNNDDIPSFLLGAFYGRYEFTKDNSYIYTYSAYRNWAKVYDNQELCDKSKISFLNQLNNICKPFSFWAKGTKQFPKYVILNLGFKFEVRIEIRHQ